MSQQKAGYQLASTTINGAYVITTIHRKSSAMVDSEIWYFETIVWRIVNGVINMVEMIDSGFDEATAFANHSEICNRFYSIPKQTNP